MHDKESPLLIIEKGVSEASVVILGQDTHVLGRLPHADTGFASPYVSRRHAEITCVGGRFLIRDLGSRNSTLVNGQPIATVGHWLSDEDRISLVPGEVELRFYKLDRTLQFPGASSHGVSGLNIDIGARDIHIDGNLLSPPLSRKEFDVLALLYERTGQACSKDDIAHHGWPERGKGGVADQEIDQCIRRIRVRLEEEPSKPKFVITIRGYGYKLALP